MKTLIYVLTLSLTIAACTSSTSTTSTPLAPAPADLPDYNPTGPQRENTAKVLSKTLLYAYSDWQNEITVLSEKKNTSSEGLKLAKEFLLGQNLRNVDELQAPERLLMVRADFKNRQGPQSEADFLPLAKKILEKN